MRFSTLVTIGVVLLVLAGAILGFACAGHNVDNCTWTAHNYIIDIEGVDLNSVDQVVLVTPLGRQRE